MNTQMTEAYSFYKNQYPTMAILFRIRNNFHAYFEDAVKISALLNITTDPPSNSDVVIPADQILEYTEKLYQHGVLVKTISWRNNEGEFALPDIQQLQNEQKLDY